MGSLFANLPHVMDPRDRAVEERRVRRDLVDLVSHVTARGMTHAMRVINVSPLGLMCRTDAQLLVAEKVMIWLPVAKEIAAEIRWAENGRVGMEFLSAVPTTIYDAMLSVIPPRRTEW